MTPGCAVFLHSSASGGRQWDAIAEPLRGPFDVHAPDLLGYRAQETWPVGTPTSLRDEAHALVPLLEAQGDGVHLVGHSYGGAVALEIALRWPTLVRSLTLIEPVRFALLFDAANAAVGDAIVGVGRRIGWSVLSGGLHAAAELFVDYWSGPGAWSALTAKRREAIAVRMPKVQAEFEALFADPTPAAAYGRLAMPVRLVVGDRSPEPARAIVARLARLLPHAATTTLHGLGHMAPLTHPARVARALPAWLQPAADEQLA